MVRADVTEILAAERQAKSRLEKALCSAEEANRAKSDFLSAMSHDIRTPMNAIMGMTALAPQHLDDRKWMEGCLQKISISSKHLLSLVNDVLDMSRIEQGKFTLNPVQLSIPELAEHLSVMMEAQAKEAGIAFAVRTERIAHKAFFGDSLRIDQTLINLLSNAVKFTPEGGRVDFLIEEIPPALPAGRVRYRFTVRDTGVGMSETFLQKAFEPFTRDESAARIQGTGLGLSIVHGLVELMQGAISAESRLGEGSVFRVELEFELEGTYHSSVIIKLYRQLPRIEFAYQVAKTLSTDIESLYMPLSLNLPGSSLHIHNGGVAMRPGVDQLPGSNMEYYMADQGVLYQRGGEGILINALDTSLLYMGRMEHHPILLCDNREENNHRPVYSWIMNNTWETNFKMDLSGFGEFRYALELREGSLEENLRGLKENDMGTVAFIVG